MGLGTNIYYTTDGTDPTTASAVYEAPFEITEDCTVKAFAVKDGWESSSISSVLAWASMRLCLSFH